MLISKRDKHGLCAYRNPLKTTTVKEKFSVILFPILFVLMLASCQHRCPSSLVEVDSLMYTNPKTALEKLDSFAMRMDTTKEADVMYLRLLQAMVKDKLFLPFGTLDSIQEIAAYYERKEDKQLLPMAYYLLGRKLCDMHEVSQAFANFRKVLDLLARKETDEKLRAVTCSQIAYMLTEVGDFESANLYFRQALMSDSVAKNQVGMALNLRDIAMGEMAMDSSRSAFSNLYRALEIASKLKDEKLMQDINLQLANCYLYGTNNLDSVSHYLTPSLKNRIDFKNITLDFIASEYYWGMEREDSCEYYLLQVLKHGNVSEKQEAARRLTLMSIDGNKSEATLCFLDKYFDYGDTLRISENKETKQDGMALLSFVSQNEKIKKLNDENFQKFIILLVLVFALVVLIFLLCLYYQMSLVKKLRLKNKINELKLSIFMLDNSKSKQKKCIKIKLELMEYVEVGKCLHDEQWDDLEMKVKNVFPKFQKDLCSLYKLSDMELHICLLLKVGMETKEISTLISRSKQAISMTKKRLICKITNSETGRADELDELLKEL